MLFALYTERARSYGRRRAPLLTFEISTSVFGRQRIGRVLYADRTFAVSPAPVQADRNLEMGTDRAAHDDHVAPAFENGAGMILDEAHGQRLVVRGVDDGPAVGRGDFPRLVQLVRGVRHGPSCDHDGSDHCCGNKVLGIHGSFSCCCRLNVPAFYIKNVDASNTLPLAHPNETID